MRLPGDIILVNELLYEDMQGFIWCSTKDDTMVRSKRRLKNDEINALKNQFNSNQDIPVVCVSGSSPKDDISLFEMDSHYENDLISYYYEKKAGRLTGKGQNQKVWEARFSDGDAGNKFIKCSNPFSSRISKKLLPPFMTWKTAFCDSWRLPVFSDRQADYLTGSGGYRFQPLEQFIYGFFSPACGKSIKELPVIFEAKINSSDASTSKGVIFVIHGFNLTKQWHYKFWKHVVCGAPSSEDVTNNYRNGNEERKLWEKTLSTIIPAKKVFENCKEFNTFTCEDCNFDQFSQVHNEALDPLEEYFQLAFTIFENAKTKQMKIKKYSGDTQRHRAIITCRDSVTLKNGDCLNLGLLGVSYDWQEKSNPTIHLSIQTFFYKPSNSYLWSSDTHNDPFWKGPGTETWRFDHVARQQP